MPGLNGGSGLALRASRGVSVKSYGARGDGTTDDTAAITAAEAAAVAAGGGSVFFPAGTYITTLQTIDANVTWVGDGFAATIIKLKDGSNTDLLQTRDFTANYAAGGSTLGPYGFGLRDLTLDGNIAGNASGGYCFRAYGYGYRVQGVRFMNGKSGGVFSSWGTSGIATNMEAHWSDFTISECAGDGLHWEGPHDSIITNGEIWTLAGGRQLNYALFTGGNAAGDKFSDVHTWGKQSVGWRLEKRISAVNCTAEGAGDVNLWLIAHQSYWHGDIYGTNRNGSINTNECGIRFGDVNLDNGTADCYVWANIFNFVEPCFPVDYAHSFSNRLEGVARMPGTGRPTRLWTGTPVSEHAYVVSNSNSTALELKLDPRPPAVQKATLTTKGDIFVATGASTIVRLPVGADGTALGPDSTQASGLTYFLPSGAVVTLGLNQIGASINALTNGSKYGSRFQVPGSLEIRTVQVPFDGLGAGSGTQTVRVVIHSDTAGAPDALLATSDELTINAGEAMSWRTFTLPADLALSTGYVWLGFHGGPTGGVARYSYTQGAGGAYVYASDAYGNGADSTFGTGTSVGNQLLNIRATSLSGSGTPGNVSGEDDGASQGDFDTLNAGAGITLSVAGDTAELAVPAVATLTADVVDLDDRVSDLEAGGGGGGGGIVTTIVDTGSLSAAEESPGPWIDTGEDSGGVFIVASSKASAAGTLYLEDSADGVTGTVRQTVVTAANGGQQTASAMGMSGARYVRARYLNGAGAATGFELTVGHSVTA